MSSPLNEPPKVTSANADAASAAAYGLVTHLIQVLLNNKAINGKELDQVIEGALSLTSTTPGANDLINDHFPRKPGM